MSLDEAAAHPRGGKLRVLSLDGGGIRGLSSLLVLDALMKQIDPISPPKPCEVFDLIGGTSTGGLIAIMLGRLNMDMASCIRAYRDMSESIFKPKDTLNIAAKVLAKYHARERFSSSALEKAVKTVIVSTGRSVEELMCPGIDQKCKIFVCAVSRECPGRIVRFRNYRSTGPAPLNPQIWEAARATSAATSFFDPIAIGPFGQEFLDGATGANNPVEIALKEARDIWPDGMGRLQYIISIGTGEPSLAAFGDNLLSIGKTLVRISTDANAVAAQFARSHPELAAGTDHSRHIYQRFNVKKGLEDVKLQEAEKTKEIASATHRYLDEDEQRARLRAFGEALQSRPAEEQHQQMSSGNIHFTFKGVWKKSTGAAHTGTEHADTPLKEIYEKYLLRYCSGISLPGVEEMIPYVTDRIHASVTSGPCSYDIANPLINENVPIHLYFNRLLKWSPPTMKVQVGSFYRGWKTVLVNDDLSIRFVRTVRLPDAKSPHKLPMGFGTLPVFEMSEIQKCVGKLDSLPEHIREKGGLIIPMYENEAMFLSFESKRGTYAIRPFLGGVNAISGNTFVPNMATMIRQLNKTERKQDYVLVTPDKKTSQRWLDGARTGRGVVRQFTAVSATSEFSVEHQVAGTNTVGGLQFEIIPQHESCCNQFWSFVFGREKLSVPFLATPKDVGLVAGCGVYATTGTRRTVTLGDLLHDSQTLRILASKGTPSDPGQTVDSEGALVLQPFAKLDNAFVIKVWAALDMPKSKITSFRHYRSSYDPFTFFLCLPKDWRSQDLFEWAFGLVGLEFCQARLLYEGMRVDLGDNAITVDLQEGDSVDIHLEGIGGGTSPDSEIDLTLGAGAEIAQAIVPDTSDPRVWDLKRGVLFNVQILDSASFRLCTGLSPPPPPIAFRTYVKRKYPFLSLNEPDDITTPVKLGHLKPAPDARVSKSDATTSSSGTSPLPPGYCHSCKQVYARANRYTPCGHTICQKCEDGEDYDFDPEYVNIRKVCGGWDGRRLEWTCCICGSKECELVGNIHDVQPQEMDEMCEKFRSVLDLDGEKTTWAYDCFEREDGGLGVGGGEEVDDL